MEEDKFRTELEEILRQMASMVDVASEAVSGSEKRKKDVFRGMEEAEIKRRETRVNKVAVSFLLSFLCALYSSVISCYLDKKG